VRCLALCADLFGECASCCETAVSVPGYYILDLCVCYVYYWYRTPGTQQNYRLHTLTDFLAVQFPNMAAAISFMQKLLEAFLTGFALATGTNLFIFPTSARSVVFKEMTGYLMCLSGMLKAQTAYMQSMETIDPIALRHQREEEQRESEQDGTKKKARKPAVPLSSPLATPASLKLKELLGKTVELHTKLHGDVTPAKREFAIGKLESHDLTEVGTSPVWHRLSQADYLSSLVVEDAAYGVHTRHWTQCEYGPDPATCGRLALGRQGLHRTG